MIKINFHTSYPLSEGILKSKFNQNESNLDLSKIENLFDPKKKMLLEELYKLTRMEFKSTEIHVWLIHGLYPSIPRPALLNVSKEENIILFDLIKILTHIIFDENNFYNYFETKNGINETKLEAMVQLISKKVIITLLNKKEYDSLMEKLLSDKFNLYLWDESKNFEEKIDFNKSLFENSKELFE